MASCVVFFPGETVTGPLVVFISSEFDAFGVLNAFVCVSGDCLYFWLAP